VLGLVGLGWEEKEAGRDTESGEGGVEETFVNENPGSTLKLGQARGVAMLAPAMSGLKVAEYTPNLIKKSVVGSGHAEKQQIQAMIGFLLPKAKFDSADEAAFHACIAANRRETRPRHKYSAGEFGLTPEGIANAFASYHRKYLQPTGITS